MRMRRSATAAFGRNTEPIADVLDEVVRHHDMGVNDILVDEGSGLNLDLKE